MKTLFHAQNSDIFLTAISFLLKNTLTFPDYFFISIGQSQVLLKRA